MRELDNTDTLVKMRRPDGREFFLRVPKEHWQRVMDLVGEEFADINIQLGGPKVPEAL